MEPAAADPPSRPPSLVVGRPLPTRTRLGLRAAWLAVPGAPLAGALLCRALGWSPLELARTAPFDAFGPGPALGTVVALTVAAALGPLGAYLGLLRRVRRTHGRAVLGADQLVLRAPAPWRDVEVGVPLASLGPREASERGVLVDAPGVWGRLLVPARERATTQLLARLDAPPDPGAGAGRVYPLDPRPRRWATGALVGLAVGAALPGLVAAERLVVVQGPPGAGHYGPKAALLTLVLLAPVLLLLWRLRRRLPPGVLHVGRDAVLAGPRPVPYDAVRRLVRLPEGLRLDARGGRWFLPVGAARDDAARALAARGVAEGPPSARGGRAAVGRRAAIGAGVIALVLFAVGVADPPVYGRYVLVDAAGNTLFLVYRLSDGEPRFLLLDGQDLGVALSLEVDPGWPWNHELESLVGWPTRVDLGRARFLRRTFPLPVHFRRPETEVGMGDVAAGALSLKWFHFETCTPRARPLRWPHVREAEPVEARRQDLRVGSLGPRRARA